MTTGRPPSIMQQRRVTSARGTRAVNSFVASAAVMTGSQRSNAPLTTAGWQAKAWQYYDEVGELRFGVSWLANALSRVNLIAAAPPTSQGAEPEPIDLSPEGRATESQRRAVEIVSEIAGGVAGQGQLLAAMAKQLTVPGVGYILATADDITDSFSTWRVLSNDEARRNQDVTEVRDAETGEWAALEDNALLIKVWRSHPRNSWEPDSPVHALLGVLDEITLLSSRIAADAKSRLAGNGLLVIPEEAEFPKGQGGISDGGLTDPDSAPEGDEFTETLVKVMTVPITDQDSPAATVPLVIRVPGEWVDKIQHLKFYSEFDASLDTLRQAGVKRLALGLDMPPETLLGMGASNHWSAWQIAEEAVTLQVEPLAETIVHALTIGFLRVVLLEEGLNPDEALVWYDTTDLTTRPDRSASASEAHARLKISDAAYLRELGLDPADAPGPDELRLRLLLQVAAANPAVAPALLEAAGLLPSSVRALTTGDVMPAGDPPPSGDVAPNGPPERPTDPPGLTSSLLAAADGLVFRALEVAGRRLRAAAGRKVVGGSAAVPCDDPTLLHTRLSATEHASLDELLAGAWGRCDAVADRYGLDGDSLAACLDGYTRGLLASGHAHDFERLALAIGADDAPSTRRLAAAY